MAGDDDSDKGSRVGSALVALVERQIREAKPKEVGGTLIRLCLLGMSRDEAIRHIAFALMLEMQETMRDARAFEEKRYIAKLHMLPGLMATTGR